MKKVKKMIVMVLSILVVSMLMAGEANAASFTFKAEANKTEAKPGDEIVISMGISNIDMGDLGINAIEGILDYDDEVFEKVSRDDIGLQNNWTITYNEEAGAHEGNFLISNIVAGIKTEQKIGEIRLKIREDAKANTETEIKIKNITSNDGGTLVKETDKSIIIKIGEKTGTNGGNSNGGSSNGGSLNGGSSNGGSSNGGSSNGGSSNGGSSNGGSSNGGSSNGGSSNGGNLNGGSSSGGSSNSGNKNMSQNNMPNTGADNIVKVAIAILGITAVGTYMKYKGIKIK